MKKVKVTGKKVKRIKDTSPRQKKVSQKKFAKGIGGEPTTGPGDTIGRVMPFVP